MAQLLFYILTTVATVLRYICNQREKGLKTMRIKEENRNYALMAIDHLLDLVETPQQYSDKIPSEIEVKLFELSHWFQEEF